MTCWRGIGDRATLIVLSDHGFANFGRQFNLNSWLRRTGYLGPPDCTSLLHDVDWSRTTAYGMGINGLYLNLKGRERDGVVEPGQQREQLLDANWRRGLEAVRDARRAASHPPRAPHGPGLLGQRNRVGARSDRGLLPRLPGVLGHVPGRADRRDPSRQRLGLECGPLRRCVGSARGPLLQSSPGARSPLPDRSGPVDSGGVRLADSSGRWRGGTSLPDKLAVCQRQGDRTDGQDQDRLEPFDRAKRAAEVAGYSSVEEFVAHCIESELQKYEAEEARKQVTDQLRGLGYVE